MEGLIAFLRARYDEVEAAAKAWQSPPWREDATRWKPVGRREVRYDNGCSETFSVIDVSGRDLNWAEAIQVKWDSNSERVAHIALHDPAAVLRDIAGKRKILDAYAEVAYMDIAEPEPEFAYGRAVGLGEAVRHLAAEFSTHPDYNTKVWSSFGG